MVVAAAGNGIKLKNMDALSPSFNNELRHDEKLKCSAVQLASFACATYTKSHLSLSALYTLQVAHFAQAELIYDGTAHSLDALLGRENTCVLAEN
jgi:hypothetical protein